jgi:hypothetical protein
LGRASGEILSARRNFSSEILGGDRGEKRSRPNEFKIDASRLEADGKAESQPIDKNDNPAGKANNRRVEFIKK